MNGDRNRVKLTVAAVSLLVLLACILPGACTFPQAGGDKEPPSVTITDPASGASVLADSNVAVSATASGGVPFTRMELWLDGELVDTQESSVEGGVSPFDASFELLVPQGAHTLVVRAVNADALTVDSWPVQVSGVEDLSTGPEPTAGPVMSISTSTPVSPSPESPEPVEISFMAREGRVAGNTPIVLRLGWETDTSEQVADFLSSAELVVRLDGELVPDSGQYWGDVEESGDRDQNGEPNYQTVWRYPLGVLSPGTHQVEAELRFQRRVTDGFDSDGDGAPEEYSGTLPFSLHIVVGE